MTIRTVFFIALACFGVATAEAQVKRNGVWQGGDLQRGNPHGLAPDVLHREPAACSSTAWQQPRGVYEDPSWEFGIIPFEFSNNVSVSEQAAMLNAMNEVVIQTGVTFVERSTETDYIFIQDSNVNNSFVGRIGGAQTINIFNWNFRFIMVHELMHAIGVWHEQSAFDRDTFVTVNFDAIVPGAEHNFAIVPDANVTEFYDYQSVMHYGQYAFSIAPGFLPTITTANPDVQSVIGQREYLSSTDIEGLQDMHGGPIPTQWFDGLPSSIFDNGTFVFPWPSFEAAVALVPDGGRIVSQRSHVNSISGPVVINRNVTITGAPVTIGGN